MRCSWILAVFLYGDFSTRRWMIIVRDGILGLLRLTGAGISRTSYGDLHA